MEAVFILKKTSIIHYNYKETQIPIKISWEWRRNIRVSIGRKEIHLRIPALSSEKFVKQQIQWAKEWLTNQLERKPELLQRFVLKNYAHGDLLKINDEFFTLYIMYENRKTLGAQIKDQYINVKVPFDMDSDRMNATIKQLLSRTLSSYFMDEVKNRITSFNQMYFGEILGDIRIKYNKSNWGSCSAKKNINISSRILFAPKPVQDYVFIHELTHLIELNHSPKFWKIVASIVPDYKLKEKWLKENGHLCDF